MIDGIKLDCNYLSLEQWANNPELLFKRPVYERTGELPNETRIAKYKNLTFRIIPSKKHEKTIYYTLTGSLHKYSNSGEHNNNDFTSQDLTKIINDLEINFSIDRYKAIVRTFEFGVNIKVPIPASKFIKYLISISKDRFIEMDIKPNFGKVIDKKEYRIKIYDKSTVSDNQQIRIEIKVLKMRYINRHINIQTLGDLEKADVLHKLKDIILSMWDDVILYDESIKFDTLNDREKLLIQNFKNPNFWTTLSKSQRYKKRHQFNQLITKYNAFSLHKQTKEAIYEKCISLIGHSELQPKIPAEKRRPFHHENNKKPADKRRPFHPKKQFIPAHEKATFSPLEYRVKKSPCNDVTYTNIDILHTTKKTAYQNSEKKTCPICKSQFINSRKNRIYCSKKCKDKAAQIKRTSKARETRKTENHNLKKLPFPFKATDKFFIKQTNKLEYLFTYTDIANSKDIKIRSINYVRCYGCTFTTRNAKSIIKIIQKNGKSTI